MISAVTRGLLVRSSAADSARLPEWGSGRRGRDSTEPEVVADGVAHGPLSGAVGVTRAAVEGA
jgi:hypothetical protein